MWRRLVSSLLKTLSSSSTAAANRSFLLNSGCLSLLSSLASNHHQGLGFGILCDYVVELFEAVGGVKKRVINYVIRIANGHEREELESELEGRKLLDVNFPVGPFGTKELPAVVKSYYDRSIVVKSWW